MGKMAFGKSDFGAQVMGWDWSLVPLARSRWTEPGGFEAGRQFIEPEVCFKGGVFQEVLPSLLA